MNINLAWTGRITALVLTAAGICGVANADLIDVAFYNSGYGGTLPVGPAVLGQAGDQWNWIDAANCPSCPGNISLIATTGAGTPAVLNFTADGAVRSATVGTAPDPNLMNNYIFNNTGGSLALSLTGLAPSQTYSVVLYVSSFDASGGNRSLAGTVSGASVVPFSATGNPQSTFVNGQNLVELSATSDVTGALTITESDGLGNTSGEVDLNGLQVMNSSATPEPGYTAVLLLGTVAALWRSRRVMRRQ